MSQNKDELIKDVETMDEDSVDETGDEPLVLVDEKGNELNEEQAREEEERLNSLLDNFFMSQLAQPKGMTAEEAEDDEDVTVTVNSDGDVVKEEIVKTKELDASTIHSGHITLSDFPGPSIFEEELLTAVILERKRKINEAMEEIDLVQEAFYAYIDGGVQYDNVVDSIRREKNELQSLLAIKPVSLNNLKNDRLKELLKKDLHRASRQLVQLAFRKDND